ncbi:putative N terminus of Rad21 / Rec8 like protein [Paratrimastix pyriformis]|uniref:N terminus of Rad21 / Rec8 like protein n=1 Tax=Paratrimastix pyriformis TaxID=342808 RepID=A0ABQ8UI09_9EUKA|nr:putative N terminus of Rad21 / Rec8 like protein [Paratrimastix pyriformis]
MVWIHQILARKATLGRIWMAGTLRRLAKHQFVDSSLPLLAKAVRHPEVPVDLRTQSTLLYGLVVIYDHKCRLLLDDSNKTLLKVQTTEIVLTATDLPQKKMAASSAKITLPDIDAFPLDLTLFQQLGPPPAKSPLTPTLRIPSDETAKVPARPVTTAPRASITLTENAPPTLDVYAPEDAEIPPADLAAFGGELFHESPEGLTKEEEAFPPPHEVGSPQPQAKPPPPLPQPPRPHEEVILQPAEPHGAILGPEIDLTQPQHAEKPPKLEFAPISPPLGVTDEKPVKQIRVMPPPAPRAAPLKQKHRLVDRPTQLSTDEMRMLIEDPSPLVTSRRKVELATGRPDYEGFRCRPPVAMYAPELQMLWHQFRTEGLPDEHRRRWIPQSLQNAILGPPPAPPKKEDRKHRREEEEPPEEGSTKRSRLESEEAEAVASPPIPTTSPPMKAEKQLQLQPDVTLPSLSPGFGGKPEIGLEGERELKAQAERAYTFLHKLLAAGAVKKEPDLEPARVSFFQLTSRLNKGDVARSFFQLLVLSTKGRIHVEQNSAYGDILVSEPFRKTPLVKAKPEREPDAGAGIG